MGSQAYFRCSEKCCEAERNPEVKPPDMKVFVLWNRASSARIMSHLMKRERGLCSHRQTLTKNTVLQVKHITCHISQPGHLKPAWKFQASVSRCSEPSLISSCQNNSWPDARADGLPRPERFCWCDQVCVSDSQDAETHKQTTETSSRY